MADPNLEGAMRRWLGGLVLAALVACQSADASHAGNRMALTDSSPAPWIRGVDTARSPMGDPPTITASALAFGGVSYVLGDSVGSAMLSFRCEAGKPLDGYVMLSGYLDDGEDVPVRVRVDSGTAFTPRTRVARNGFITFRAPWVVLDSLQGARSLLVEFKLDQGARHVARFNVRGAGDVHALLQAHCLRRS